MNNNKNKNSSSSNGRKRTGKKGNKNKTKGRQTESLSKRFGIPSRMPFPRGDVVPLTMRASKQLTSDGTGVASLCLVYGRGASSGTYTFLDDLIVGFGALCPVYSRFLIKNLRIEARCISSLVNGGFTAFNYEPTDTNRSNPPSTLIDVSNSVNYDMATPGVDGCIVVRPMDYFNDWKPCVVESSAISAPETQFGVTQVLAVGALSSVITVIDITVEVLFSGYNE